MARLDGNEAATFSVPPARFVEVQGDHRLDSSPNEGILISNDQAMRLSREQFTIKRMMIVVAVLAVIIGALRIVWLRYSYLRLAGRFAITEDLYRGIRRFEVETGKTKKS